VRLQPALLRALDKWVEQEQEKDALSRPEAIRRLVELGLKAKNDRQKSR
jgi:metal-responsive CopG/Arc/MetJ family transcriptional regulator